MQPSGKTYTGYETDWLLKVCLRMVPSGLKPVYEIESMDGQSYISVVARLAGERIAWADAKVNQGLLWKSCYLSDLYVSSNHQRHGYGSELLKRIEVQAKERGCMYLELMTVPDAEEFYKKKRYSRPWLDRRDSPRFYKYL
jgi:GNAT superfamily N-acetyltransferase